MFNPVNSPIIKKDLKVISRSMKFSWGLFAYEVVLTIVFLFSLSIMSVSRSYTGVYSNTDMYSGYIYFFPIVGITELIIIALIVPIITASSISGERERKTMDVLLTTTITSTNIILGKIGSAVIRVMIFIIASLPLLSVSFIVGGLSWITLLEYVVMAFIFACFAGSVGTFASSVCRKSITAIILSYVIYLGVYGIPFVGWLSEFLVNTSRTTYYLSPLALLVDPVFTFIVFFVTRLTSEEVIGIFFDNSNGIWQLLSNDNLYIVLSEIIQIALTAVFVVLASNRIRPGKK
ncbi:MAG: ABC transporter permease subunit [Eubacterium sp.]|nr:ABC transporter permease subunit [Eubacterium sp.]